MGDTEEPVNHFHNKTSVIIMQDQEVSCLWGKQEREERGINNFLYKLTLKSRTAMSACPVTTDGFSHQPPAKSF